MDAMRIDATTDVNIIMIARKCIELKNRIKTVILTSTDAPPRIISPNSFRVPHTKEKDPLRDID